MVEKMPVRWPVVIMKEGKWYVASCPPLGIATQGRSLEEVKENMKELIVEYLNDPDTPKPTIIQVRSVKLTKISMPKRISSGSVLIGRRATSISTKSH